MTIQHTPAYGIAYLDAATPLNSLADATQQVATTVEAALARGNIAPSQTITDLIDAGFFTDTGWVALTPAAGFTASNSLAIRRIGKRVSFRGGLHRTAGNWTATLETAFTLPDTSYRPNGLARFLFPGFATVAGSPGLLGVLAAGSSSFQIAAAGSTGAADAYLDGVSWTVN